MDNIELDPSANDIELEAIPLETIMSYLTPFQVAALESEVE